MSADVAERTAQATALIVREARVLDARRYDEWLELYAANATYWVPVDPEATGPADGLNIIYDDRDRTLDRLYRLSSGFAHAEEPPSAVRRVLGCFEVVPCEHGADLDVLSTFVLAHTRLGRQRLFAGDYTHCLAAADGRLLIKRKRVGLMDAFTAHDPLVFLL